MTVPDVISRFAVMNTGLPPNPSTELSKSSGHRRFRSASSHHSVHLQEEQDDLMPVSISILPLHRPLSHDSIQSSNQALHQRMPSNGLLTGAEEADIIRQALNLNRFKLVPPVETKPKDIGAKPKAWEGDDYLAAGQDTVTRDEDDSWSTSTKSKKKKRKKRSKSAKGKKNSKKSTNKVGKSNKQESNMFKGGLTLDVVAAAVPVTKKTLQIPSHEQIKKSDHKVQSNIAQECTETEKEILSNNSNEKVLKPKQSLSLPKMSMYPSASPRLSKSQNSNTYSSNSPPLTRSQDNHTLDKLKVMKVYLSDKQSNTIKLLGLDLPCAPPATPMPEQLCRYEYVPSMTDIRSQRALKVRLSTLEKIVSQKKAKQRAEQLKQEQQNRKDQQSELKKLQRLQIYALNKVMTEFENKNFEEFCRVKGLNTSKKKSKK